MIIGYHASHEQFAPAELPSVVKQAVRAGFNGVMTSDQITPWSERQRNSGLAIPGGLRYHQVTLAHLIATLSEMFTPGCADPSRRGRSRKRTGLLGQTRMRLVSAGGADSMRGL